MTSKILLAATALLMLSSTTHAENIKVETVVCDSKSDSRFLGKWVLTKNDDEFNTWFAPISEAAGGANHCDTELVYEGKTTKEDIAKMYTFGSLFLVNKLRERYDPSAVIIIRTTLEN
jgi:hypothetical protein